LLGEFATRWWIDRQKAVPVARAARRFAGAEADGGAPLYGAREWTMERIAKALDVSKATISGDLSNCSTPEQLLTGH